MLFVVARSGEQGMAFLNNHPTLADKIQVLAGRASYFDILNDLILSESITYACVVHDDVLLCLDFAMHIENLIHQLNKEWPSWGLAGNTGTLPLRVGYSATRTVRYLVDKSGGPNLVGHILPVQSIGGNVMLLNLGALRQAKVRLPPFDAFHLYDLALSVESLAAGLGVFVAPQLACWHCGGGTRIRRAKFDDKFREYLQARIRNSEVETVRGMIPLGGKHSNSLSGVGIDLEIESLRSAKRGRPAKKVAIVTRTQLARTSLLRRTLKSVNTFIEKAGGGAEFRSYVVTDSNLAVPDWVELQSTVLYVHLADGVDSRYLLVQFAAKIIEADYFWFVDDDDWLIPDEAERLGLVVSSVPYESLIYVDTQHFHEKIPLSKDSEEIENHRPVAGRYFGAKQFLNSLSGSNFSPFCGVLFGRSVLLKIPQRIYETVVYFEDYMTNLFALLVENSFPVVVDRCLVGISIRESGHSVAEKNRMKWNKSESELVSHLVRSMNSTQLLSIPLYDLQIARDLKLLKRVTRTWYWKLTKFLYRASCLVWSKKQS